MKKKKQLKKLRRKFERLEAFSTVESRVSTLEKNSRCKFYTNGETVEYTFPAFVTDIKSDISQLKSDISRLRREISSLKNETAKR